MIQMQDQSQNSTSKGDNADEICFGIFCSMAMRFVIYVFILKNLILEYFNFYFFFLNETRLVFQAGPRPFLTIQFVFVKINLMSP